MAKITGGPHRGHAAGDTDVEKQASQLASDVKYKVRKSMSGATHMSPAQVSKAYLAQLAKSPAPGIVKTLAKKKLMGTSSPVRKEEYNNGAELATESVANALYKVFVENVKIEEPIVLAYKEELETAEHRKYKVKVTDKSGNSYVRYATRDKISSLRANPNIQAVEMTGHGEPYEGEKKKGEQTARAKAGKSLDPVGHEDKDIDNDGDHDKTDKYLLNRRKVRGSAISKRKGVAEEFLGEVNDEAVNPDANEKKIDMMKGKNKVVINPPVPGSGKNKYPGLQMAHHEMEGPFIAEKALSQAQQKFMGMVYAAKKGEKPASPEVAKAAAGMSKKEAKKFAKTKHKGLPEKVEEGVGGYDDPVLGPHTPLGQAVRTGVKVVKGSVTGAIKGAQGSLNTAKTKPTIPVKEETVAQADKKAKKEQDEMDPRSIPTATNLAKNKLRAMGLKCSHELDGKVLGENEDKERKGTDYKGRDYGPGPKPTVKIPFEGVMQGGWLKKQQAKSKEANKTA